MLTQLAAVAALTPPLGDVQRVRGAAWFTLTADASDGPVPPAPYTIEDPVPLPTREEAKAAAVCIDELRQKIEKMYTM